MSDEINFESNGQNFFVEAAFFVCFHFYLCCGNDLGRLKFSTPCVHSFIGSGTGSKVYSKLRIVFSN